MPVLVSKSAYIGLLVGEKIGKAFREQADRGKVERYVLNEYGYLCQCVVRDLLDDRGTVEGFDPVGFCEDFLEKALYRHVFENDGEESADHLIEKYKKRRFWGVSMNLDDALEKFVTSKGRSRNCSPESFLSELRSFSKSDFSKMYIDEKRQAEGEYSSLSENDFIRMFEERGMNVEKRKSMISGTSYVVKKGDIEHEKYPGGIDEIRRKFILERTSKVEARFPRSMLQDFRSQTAL